MAKVAPSPLPLKSFKPFFLSILDLGLKKKMFQTKVKRDTHELTGDTFYNCKVM